ncbi:MAG: hypothetical protein R3D30_12735 [Hyphomicrobiales bacterium]
MTKQIRIGLIVLTAVIGAAFTSSAMAASKQLCQSYARLAVQQATIMQAQNRGCVGFRWHHWYDGHYKWCREVSAGSAAGEYQVRQNTILNNGPC